MKFDVYFKVNSSRNRAKLEKNSKISINLDDYKKKFNTLLFEYPGKIINFTKESKESNSDVYKIQVRLNSLGYADKSLKLNGLCDTPTLAAVNKFKSVKKIPNSGKNYGIVDKATWNRLFSPQKNFYSIQSEKTDVRLATEAWVCLEII